MKSPPENRTRPRIWRLIFRIAGITLGIFVLYFLGFPFLVAAIQNVFDLPPDFGQPVIEVIFIPHEYAYDNNILWFRDAIDWFASRMSPD